MDGWTDQYYKKISRKYPIMISPWNKIYEIWMVTNTGSGFHLDIVYQCYISGGSRNNTGLVDGV